MAISGFAPKVPVCRAGRSLPFGAIVRNPGEKPIALVAKLRCPDGVRVVAGAADRPIEVMDQSAAELSWQLEASAPGRKELSFAVVSGGAVISESSLDLLFLPAVEPCKLDAIPPPEPVKTKLLIGAHHCPLWEADKPAMWSNLIKHPERTPALGFYAQENPEVSDWETKWAVEHGVSFFIYCWYRSSQGGPVTTRFSSAIHDALFKSRFKDRLKFTIMWENQVRGTAGVADERDLKENLFPFWMATYFKNPGYLKVDNRPVLFIYRPEFLIQDLGSVENVGKAFHWMREESKRNGFDGLYLLGEYRGQDSRHLELMKTLGLDYTFAYCWPVPGSPQPEQAVAAQMGYIRKTQELGILPQVVTVSQAWSGWRDEGSIWKIPPDGFERLLREAGEFVETLPKDQLSGRMLLLDNWNEWGEGHYLAPYREHGFGYLDAVRRVFSDAPEPHADLLPEDIGLGPYDTAYQEIARREAEFQRLGAERVTKEGSDEPGLIGWWAFDEAEDHPVALDVSGHRLGGKVIDAKRATGRDGQALVCEGGCVAVPDNPKLSVTDELTMECWVKSQQPRQPNAWIVNRIFAGGIATGYRLGILDGKPCFEIPVTDWSHHLVAAQPLPLDRWVHLAGTYDGAVMRIYVDGELQGTMERPGPIHPNSFKLCLGNFDEGHQAHFQGLLDEVKLYNRALSPVEIARQALVPPGSPVD